MASILIYSVISFLPPAVSLTYFLFFHFKMQGLLCDAGPGHQGVRSLAFQNIIKPHLGLPASEAIDLRQMDY